MAPLRTSKAYIVRQRAGIGDCVCLHPLIREVKKSFDRVYVVTSALDAEGSMPGIFEMMPEVSGVYVIEPNEWTTNSNKIIDPQYRKPHEDTPQIILSADKVFDCNGHYLIYEHETGFKPNLSLTDFWLKFFGYEIGGVPKLDVPAEYKDFAATWFADNNPDKKFTVGVVKRVGHKARDWAIGDNYRNVISYLISKNVLPIVIDYYAQDDALFAVKTTRGMNIKQVSSVLEKVDLLLTGDTGIMHIAGSLKIPTLAIFNIMPPHLRVGGYDNMHVLPEKPLSCKRSPCHCVFKKTQWSCMVSVNSAMITNKLGYLIEQHKIKSRRH